MLKSVLAETQRSARFYGRSSGLFPFSTQFTCALVVPLVLVCLLGACSTGLSHREALAQITPLHYADGIITVSDVDAIASTPDLLGLDDDMRKFVETYTGHLSRGRMRLVQLHQSIKSNAILNIEYEPDAEGGAREVFHRGSANCLSYANLFVAMAREAGLNANYQWVRVRPQWTRIGERVAVRLHVNVVVKLRSGVEYVVDIEPLTASERTKTRVLSDVDAFALYHNNIAMEALGRSELDLAWAHNVRALQLSPAMSLLWVNLGAIYRLAGQHREAERSYFYALQLNPKDHSAMNNLMVLYQLEGREADSEYWSDQVAQYRLSNPYYHAWLGDKAGETDDWSKALMHYTDALRLGPGETRLEYEMGVIHYRLGDLDEAFRYITMAIESAIRRSDLEEYRLQLETVKREQLAGGG